MSRLTIRIAMTVALTAIALGACTSAATASRSLDLSPGGAMTLDTSAPMSFGYGPISFIYCEAEFRGSLASSIPKTPGASAGTISSASFTSCTYNPGPTPTVISLGGNWNIEYRGFTGTLPNPSTLELTIEDVAWIEPDPMITGCLHGGDVDISVSLDGSPRVTGPVTLLESLLPGTGDCAIYDQTVHGDFELAPQQTLTLVN